MFTEQMSQGLSLAATPIEPQTLNNSSASTGRRRRYAEVSPRAVHRA